jgi:ABC-type bacteriocin/lantibiotic exporter with double-glycine peptidase domain
MKNSTPKLFARFWSMLRPDSAEIRNIYLFSILSGILSLGLPLGIQMIINFIELGQMSTSWFVLVFLVVLSLGLSGVLNIFQLRITENLQQRIFTRSAFEFAERIPHIKLTELLKKYATDLTHRFFDTLTIQKGLSKLLIDFTASILQLLFCLVLLSFYHSFFIFLGIVLVFTLFLIVRFTVHRGMQTSMEESSYKYKIAHWLKEISQARFSFSLSGNHKLHISRTDNHLQGYLTARDEHFKVLVKQYVYLIVFKVLIALVFLIIGGLLVINQQMNIGQFVASEIIILLVLSAVEKLILSVEVVYDVLTAIEKISQVTDLELEQELTDGFKMESTEGFSVHLDHVTCQIQELELEVLSDVSFQIKPNEKVCIVSDSSISSNLLFHLIVGLCETDHGNVTINGLPLENLNKEFLREQIGAVVDQDLLIFGNLIDNISFGRNHIDLKRIEEEVSELELKTFIQALPEKYLSILNADIQFIPRDVARKILIARAMIGDPNLLLLEEPTAGLTYSQKNTVLNRIFKNDNVTVLVASTDPAVIERFPRVIEIHQGRLVFDGSYETFKTK